MRLVRLGLRGFGSWTEPADIDLSAARTLAITGANGAGKSTIFAAIKWLLYGDGGTETIIPDTSDEAEAELDFEAGGSEWIVNRYRHRNGKTQAHLSRALPGGGREQIAFGVTAVNEAMEAVLRIGKIPFEASVFHRQGDPGGFAGGKPADRRAILAEIVGLARFDGLATAARQARRDAETRSKTLSEQAFSLKEKARKMREGVDVDGLTRRLKEARERHESALGQWHKAQQAAAEADAASSRVEGLRLEVERSTARCDAAERALTKAKVELDRGRRDLTQHKEKAKALSDRVEAVRSEASMALELQQEWAELSKVAVAAATKVSDVKGRLIALESQHRIDTERLAGLESGQDSQCFTCGRPFGPGELERALGELRSALAEQRQRMAKGQVAVAKATTAHDDAMTRQDAVADQLAQARRADDALVELDRRIADETVAAEDAEARVSDAAAELTSAEQDYSASLDAANAARANLAEAKRLMSRLVDTTEAEAAVARFAAELDRIKEHLSRAKEVCAVAGSLVEEAKDLSESALMAKEEAELEKLLAKAFSTSGIPHLVYRSAAEEVTKFANEIMGELGGEMEVRLHADAASGGLEVMVDLPDGRSRTYSVLSGGEKTRVDLALGVALSRLVGARSGEPLRMYAFDEGWGALDPEGVNGALTALRRVSHHFDLVMSVTHHPDAAAGFDARLEVSRDNGTSQCSMLWN